MYSKEELKIIFEGVKNFSKNMKDFIIEKYSIMHYVILQFYSWCLRQIVKKSRLDKFLEFDPDIFLV